MSAPLTPAQELVRSFQRGRFSEEGAAFGPGPPSPPRARPPVNPTRKSVDHFKRRQEVFPGGTPPEVETWLRLELTPWCHVYIEREAANHTAPELIERLSRVLTQALIEFIRRGDRK